MQVEPAARLVGRKRRVAGRQRVEDARLLTGRGRFIDDHPPTGNIHHAAIVRSPHAHAHILGYDIAAALKMDGVVGIVTGEDVALVAGWLREATAGWSRA